MELTERAIAGSWLLNGGRHGPGGFRVGQGTHVAAIWRPEPCLRAPFGLRGGEGDENLFFPARAESWEYDVGPAMHVRAHASCRPVATFLWAANMAVLPTCTESTFLLVYTRCARCSVVR